MRLNTRHCFPLITSHSFSYPQLAESKLVFSKQSDSKNRPRKHAHVQSNWGLMILSLF